MLGVNPELLESLVRSVTTIPDPKLRDMIQFALKCSRDPKALTETDYESLRQHGLNTSEIMEIIAMSDNSAPSIPMSGAGWFMVAAN